jgi:hypothetical protein
MGKNILIVAALVTSIPLFAACGGGTPAPEAPDAEGAMDDAAGDADDAAGDAAGDAGDAAGDGDGSGPPPGGIVRDADGDGKPDDAGSGCADKNETQCKINSNCAWSDGGKCVDAS